ncbi:MAG: hypothetical protein J7598_24480 [Mitsuaria chitosanitabida]|uniref:hypothetical protein n=1 Tax=Roseateles chitosanitabidus TaxID=65048 RepID=UPI001B1F8085|nr:hypothetical protein [Roseateles chitosanitabidus]MBO9689770.1 hypothetical protein [Roseateles chitosanitabidus]
MSKIVQAVNAMISNSDRITNVIQGSNEIFFVYNGKYKWSMTWRDNGHYLWFYPGSETIEQLSEEQWENDVAMVTYKDTDIGTKEAKASFAELYSVLKEKVFGMDKVFDDIISDDTPF